MSNQPTMPHLGNLINKFMLEKRISRAEAARLMGVTSPEMTKYLYRPSLQFHVLWKFCMALEHDFLADLQAKYPANFPRFVDPQVSELQKEIEIFERLLKK